MTMSSQAATDGKLHAVRGQAQLASVLALVASIMLIVTAIVSCFVAPAFDYLRTLRSEPALGPFWVFEVVARQFFAALPLFLFADAMAALRRALREYGEGHFFSGTAGAAVSRAGAIVLVAMAFKIALTPTIQASIEMASFALRFDFDLFDLGLLAFALFVSAVGRVLDAAAAIKAENDQII
jgi:hypothetical protein